MLYTYSYSPLLNWLTVPISRFAYVVGVVTIAVGLFGVISGFFIENSTNKVEVATFSGDTTFNS